MSAFSRPAGHQLLRRAACAVGLATISLTARTEPFSLERGLGPPGPTVRAVHAGSPAVVFDGELFWISYESWLERGTGLLALRVTEDGAVLDPNGLLPGAPTSTYGPYHTLSGAPWGALLTFLGENVLLTVRLGRDGRSADPVPRAFGTSVEAYPYPTSACLEHSCLLTFSTRTETHAVVLDGCGEPLPDVTFELPFGFWKPYPAGDSYVFLGSPTSPASNRTLQAFAMSATGELRYGPRDLPLPSENWRAFAAGPDGGLLAWLDHPSRTVALATLGAQGEPGPTTTLPFSEVTALESMSREGDHFRLGLTAGTIGLVVALDATGAPLSPALPVVAGDECPHGAPMVASGTRSALATWGFSDGSTPCLDEPPSSALLGLGADAATTPLETTGHVARMGMPGLASDGQGYLAAWYEERAGGTGLYTQALDSDGLPREDPVLTIPAGLDRERPRLSYVSYLDGRYFAELGPDPSSMDPAQARWLAEVDGATLERSAPRQQAKLGVPGSTTFLSVAQVVTRSGEDAPTYYRVSVQVADPNGAPRGVEWHLDAQDRSTELSPVAAFDGEAFDVIWTYIEDANFDTTPPVLLFARFDESGSLLGAPSELLGLGDFTARELVWGADSLFLVLAAGMNQGDENLSVVRIDRSGALLDPAPNPLPGAQGGGQRTLTAAGFDGNDLLVIWAEGLTRTAGGVARSTNDLYVTWVGADAVPRALGAVAETAEREAGGVLATADGGRALIGYARLDTNPAFLSTRAFVRALGAPGCDTDHACSDTECSDCCPYGCLDAPAPLACSTAACGDGCPEGQKCVEGVGCIAAGARQGSTIYTKGCGCRAAPTTGSPDSLILALIGLATLWSTRRKPSSVVWRTYPRSALRVRRVRRRATASGLSPVPCSSRESARAGSLRKCS